MKRYLWEFAGPRAEGIARHHVEHLREFLEKNQLEGCEAGFSTSPPNRAVAYLIAPEAAQGAIERALRPPKSEPVAG